MTGAGLVSLGVVFVVLASAEASFAVLDVGSTVSKWAKELLET